MFKTANVGTADRVIRIVIGMLLIAMPYVSEAQLWANPVFQWGLPVIGVVLVLTALLRFCPLYRLIGTTTCKTS